MFLLKASLVLAVAQLLVMALPRLSAAVKHAILVMGMSAFLLVPLLEMTAPALTVPDVGRASARPGRAEARPTFSTSPEVDAVDVVALIWMFGVALIAVRLLRSRLRLRSILRGAVAPSPRIRQLLASDRVRLLRSARVHVPMVWGMRKGTLLLPEAAETWSDDELQATFIHELGHLQRLDYLTLRLMNVVSALLWFHPQVWLARRSALAEGERACDDLVLRAGSLPTEYATHLLNVARCAPRREPLAALLAMSRPTEIEGRMLAILSPSTNRQSIGGKRLMLTIAAFLAFVTPLSAVQLATPTPAAPAPIISAEELSARPYVVVEKLEAHVCTLKLRRPTPAEPLAMKRLQQKAREYSVDGIANVSCHREIGIGFSCPTRVTCQGDAIAFEDK